MGRIGGAVRVEQLPPGVRAYPFDLSIDENYHAVRDLDVNAMTGILTRIGRSRPVSRHATLALMHKVRAQWSMKRAFTEGQRRLSKRWLKEHGFNARLDDPKLNEIQE